MRSKTTSRSARACLLERSFGRRRTQRRLLAETGDGVDQDAVTFAGRRFAGNATPAAVPATMGCTSTASRLRLGSGGLARRIPSSALARAATRLPRHIWIAIKRRSKSSPTSTDSSLRAIPRSAQCTSSIRIATGSRLHARSISSRAASNTRVRSSRVSPSETGFGTRKAVKEPHQIRQAVNQRGFGDQGPQRLHYRRKREIFCSCPAAPSRVRKPLALADRKPSEARRDLPMPPSPERCHSTCTDSRYCPSPASRVHASPSHRALSVAWNNRSIRRRNRVIVPLRPPVGVSS